MTWLHQGLDARVSGPTGRTPDDAYPVGYPMASTSLLRFTCSLCVRWSLEARTISRTSRSITARVGGDRRARSQGMDRELLGGRGGGGLPVALIKSPASLPCTYISTAPTDEMEGGRIVSGDRLGARGLTQL